MSVTTPQQMEDWATAVAAAVATPTPDSVAAAVAAVREARAAHRYRSLTKALVRAGVPDATAAMARLERAGVRGAA